MSIEEMALRHEVTCTYISDNGTSHSLTVYPLKYNDNDQPSTVFHLLDLAHKDITQVPGANTTRPLR